MGIRIADWDARYEVNESNREWKPGDRKRKGPLEYVRSACRGRDQGVGYRYLLAVAGELAPAVFGVFHKLLEIAASEPAERRDGTVYNHHGQPANADELAFITGFPVEIVARSIEVLCDSRIGWLEVVPQDSATSAETRDGCQKMRDSTTTAETREDRHEAQDSATAAEIRDDREIPRGSRKSASIPRPIPKQRQRQKQSQDQSQEALTRGSTYRGTDHDKPPPVELGVGVEEKSSCRSLGLDLNKPELARQRMLLALHDIMPLNGQERLTFGNAFRHMIDAAATGMLDPPMLDAVVLEWAPQVMRTAVRNKKGLLMKMIQKETGYRGNGKLLLAGNAGAG